MFRAMFKSGCLLALVAFSAAAGAQAKHPNVEAAERFVDLLEAGDFAAAAKKVRVDDAPASPDDLRKYWTAISGVASTKRQGWLGPAIEPYSSGTQTIVFMPFMGTNDRLGLRLQLDSGKIEWFDVAVNHAIFGPYALLPGRAVVFEGGWVFRWHALRNGSGVGLEVRGPDGQLQRMEVIKPAGPGALMMLRSAGCPADVCGQTGTLKDNVVDWMEPAASGGQNGSFVSNKVWVQGNELVTFITSPPSSPEVMAMLEETYRMSPHLRPAPQRMKLVDAPPMTDAQYAESEAKLEAMALTVEDGIAQALQGQQSRRQALTNAREARERSSARVRSFNRAMESIGGALSEVSAEVGTYDESQARLDATVASIQAQADAQRQAVAQAQARAQQQAAAERARQQAETQQEARQRGAAAEGQRRAAEQATAPARQRTQGQSQSQSQPQSRTNNTGGAAGNAVTAARSAAPSQMLVACFVVHNGDFDQGKGVLFFSEIGPVSIANGYPVGDPTGTFAGKVKATYNVRGSPGCRTSTDPGDLRAFFQDVSDSYRAHKKVQTGMTPLN